MDKTCHFGKCKKNKKIPITSLPLGVFETGICPIYIYGAWGVIVVKALRY